NLGKFKAKGDEGYFIRYSMSSKAFRVFNKRTKRVEENLHVDFLENKAIEKGAGPNWLFDIDSLTKSMNYVPLVVAGTNSTNLSGTKDATSQEVKKDVSSLRYIALPNWVHDALLGSSSSKPQDDCSTEVSESCGNSNPTASSTNPLADQIETLTVETPIPTVSSPVPTACFTDSQEPSSDTRLISKRVANQVETPSLDNILTLTNRFEDILRVTTNSVDLDGVEADEEGIDYDEVFASVARIKAIKLFLAYALFMGFTVYQMDVKSAFLYGTIDEEVLQVLQKKDGIFLSQDKYVGDILKKFRYSDVRSSNNPMDKDNPWGKDETGKDVDLHLYRSIIGSLMYLTASRPNIMFAVCACARHQVTPKECHLHAVKRIFRYLKGHPKLGIWYPKESPFDLVAHSDSDYGGATQDRKSTTGGYQDRANIAKTPTLPSDSTPRVTSLVADEGSMKQKLDELTVLCTSLQRQQSAMVSKLEAQELEINSLKGRRLDEGEEAAERVSDDTEEMATVLTSMDAASILTSGGVQVVLTAAEVATATVSIPTGSGVVSTASPTIPTAAPIFTTATESTPYTRRKELPIERRIELISDLVKYQDNYAKVLKYQTQQRKPLTRKQQREFYTLVLRNQAGWKAKHFKGITLEEIKEKFDLVWKQIQDFVPIGSKEEAERFKRKGLRLEQESVKNVTPLNLSMQQNIEYPRVLHYRSIAQDIRTTTKCDV
nr:hypothetical protein [Tanacetum cinerariifolium]